jgi:hypothetical protein
MGPTVRRGSRAVARRGRGCAELFTVHLQERWYGSPEQGQSPDSLLGVVVQDGRQAYGASQGVAHEGHVGELQAVGQDGDVACELVEGVLAVWLVGVSVAAGDQRSRIGALVPARGPASSTGRGCWRNLGGRAGR